MTLNKTMDALHTYSCLKGKEDLRFALFDWLKEKGLTAQEACALLSLTKEAISNAYQAESHKIRL